MRKLIYSINLTLDGCCDHTKGMADEEQHEFYAQLLRTGDMFVYGRKTYQLMVPFWPDIAKTNSAPSPALNDFAHAFTSVKEVVVFSRSLNSVAEKNARIVNTDLKEEILKLKNQEGKNILTGGVEIPAQLIELGLVDEFHFMVQPRLVGRGVRLLENSDVMETLELVNTRIFKSGCVLLQYRKR